MVVGVFEVMNNNDVSDFVLGFSRCGYYLLVDLFLIMTVYYYID